VRSDHGFVIEQIGSEARMAMPPEMLDAIIAVLDAESRKSDRDARIRLLEATAATFEAWRRGRITTEQALVLMRAAIAIAEP
jgi:hypothetical protein